MLHVQTCILPQWTHISAMFLVQREGLMGMIGSRNRLINKGEFVFFILKWTCSCVVVRVLMIAARCVISGCRLLSLRGHFYVVLKTLSTISTQRTATRTLQKLVSFWNILENTDLKCTTLLQNGYQVRIILSVLTTFMTIVIFSVVRSFWVLGNSE